MNYNTTKFTHNDERLPMNAPPALSKRNILSHQTTLRFSPKTFRLLSAAAKRQQTSHAHIIRLALHAWLTRRTSRP